MSNDTPRSVGRRIFWVLGVTLLWLFILAALAGLAYLGYLGVQEAQRSLGSVTTRVEANSEAITGLAEDVQALRGETSAQQKELQSMGRSVTGLTEQTGRLEAEMADELAATLARQETLLDGLQAQLEATNSSGETALGDLASLSEAVTALQTDLNANSGQIDALGGELDRLGNAVEGLEGQTAVLDTSLTDLETAVADDSKGAELRETLALFRVWELITRARLRLAENNFGLAQGDVETAVRTLDKLVATLPDEPDDAYATVQGRLALAFANLPDDPETAAADLETAWDELDTILEQKILPEFTAELDITTPEAEPTPTPTP